jgi:hypothetical protein
MLTQEFLGEFHAKQATQKSAYNGFLIQNSTQYDVQIQSRQRCFKETNQPGAYDGTENSTQNDPGSVLGRNEISSLSPLKQINPEADKITDGFQNLMEVQLSGAKRKKDRKVHRQMK